MKNFPSLGHPVELSTFLEGKFFITRGKFFTYIDGKFFIFRAFIPYKG